MIILTKFENLIEWVDRNTCHLKDQGTDTAISKIWNGFEVVTDFKIMGIGPENFPLFKVRNLYILRI